MCFSLDTRPQIDNRLLGILFCAEGKHCVFFLFLRGVVNAWDTVIFVWMRNEPLPWDKIQKPENEMEL